MKYCRYCSFCICGDWYYCTAKEKVLRRVDVHTNCSEFSLSELGDVETGRQYHPRKKRAKQSEGQIEMEVI